MRGTIMVVDDDEDTAELLGELLRMRGYDAIAVSSAQQCLDHLQTLPADVVVTDIRMPGISGLDLCKVLRDRHPDVLPIVVTGNGDMTTEVAAIRAGAYEVIVKPVKIDALEVVIDRALGCLAVVHSRLQSQVARAS